MMASWLIMLIALPLIGIFAGGFVLIVLAIVKGRGGPAILSGIVGLLGLLFAAGVLLSFIAVRSPVAPAEPVAEASFDNAYNFSIDGDHGSLDELPFEAVSNAWSKARGNSQTTWSISLTPLLFIICGGVALFVLALKRGFGHACAAGHGRIWPAFVALPVIALFMVGGVRYRKSQDVQPPRIAENHERAHVAIQHNKGKQLFAKSQADAIAKVHQQIEKMDINELMDKFDAPQIVLRAPLAPVASPGALIVVTLPATIEIPYTIAALTTDDSKTKSVANGANAVWAKLKRPSKAPSAPSNAPEADAPIEDVVAVPPAAPVPPTPPVPGATPAKILEPAKERIAMANDMKADFQFAAANKTPTGGERPAWTDEPPKKTGATRREVIKSGPYATSEECYLAADVYLILKTYDHVRQLQDLPYQEAELPSVTFQNGMIFADGQPFATGKSNPGWIDQRPNYLRSLGIGVDFIRRELVAKDPKNKNETREYLETVQQSFGPMQQLYMQIEFTPAIDSEIRQMLDAAKRQSRFGMVGLGAGSVLGLLSMVWGLLKLDTATKGYYTKWLFLGVPATIIGATIVSMWAMLA